MSESIIKIEGLGKRYRIHHEQPVRYKTLRDTIAGQFSRLANPKPRMSGPQSSDEDFWALKDVSFEINQGDVVGIIGRNGAGKSTLLKILSRITEPTEGRITLRGRVSSLLEVGTGFHPELTGRENIFLNGAILGMNKAEIRAKFDEIVAFAEVERFLDTAVKHYSSGMYVRLAFAVAAHLEPEILIVDEVLAVGDAEFQKKCLGKMKDVAVGGRTVLLVSHNISSVLLLCSRCLLFDQGKIKSDGSPSLCAEAYLQQRSSQNTFERPADTQSQAKIVAGQFIAQTHVGSSAISLKLQIFSSDSRRLALDLRLADKSGNAVGFGSLGTFDGTQMLDLRPGLNAVQVSFPTVQLATGSYSLSLDLAIPGREYLDRAENCLTFDLEPPLEKEATRGMMQSWGYGSMRIPLQLVLNDP